MATGKTYFVRPGYRFLSSDLTDVAPSGPAFELDESDVCFSASSAGHGLPELRRPARPGRKPYSDYWSDLVERPRAAPSSLPVNIPDWSKIYRDVGSRGRGGGLGSDLQEGDEDVDAGEGDGGSGSESRLPPHEFLARQVARTKIGSFSVHEGVGRTLKGRDLSRVRNAVWARTGFQD
ncbi:hypothetical protein SAY87_016287 [Trapa incisa]|uniref:Senescence regulator n=1 Tax=Trapa incisa TaxID=236973 RepID=A0AAN7QXD2_9MYRT|nr:hypothetical protein SAY87_016287 [Trapa incisa]